MSQEEVTRLIDSASNLSHRAMLMTLYSTGVRRAELVHLKVEDIDSQRMAIHVRQADGCDRKADCGASPLGVGEAGRHCRYVVTALHPRLYKRAAQHACYSCASSPKLRHRAPSGPAPSSSQTRPRRAPMRNAIRRTFASQQDTKVRSRTNRLKAHSSAASAANASGFLQTALWEAPLRQAAALRSGSVCRGASDRVLPFAAGGAQLTPPWEWNFKAPLANRSNRS